MDKKNTGVKIALGVLPVFLMTQCSFILNSALAAVSAAFPEIPFTSITLLSTLVTLMSVPTGIIFGLLVGKKIHYRTITILSAVLIIVAGCFPYFYLKNFYVLLISRVICGIGIGFSTPLGNAIVMSLFRDDPDKQAKMNGIGNTMMNLSGVILQLIAGWVCVFNVRYVFLVHALMIIPLVLCGLFLPEPEPIQEATASSDTPKAKINWKVWFVCLTWGFAFMSIYPYLLNISAILAGEGLGNSASASYVASGYAIGGMVSGVLFAMNLKIFKKFLVPCMYALCGLCMIVGFFSSSVFIFIAVALILGIFIFSNWAGSFVEFNEIVAPEAMPMASGMFTACLGGGGFLSTFFMMLVQNISGSADPRTPILYGGVLLLVIAAVWMVYKMAQKKQG